MRLHFDVGFGESCECIFDMGFFGGSHILNGLDC